ncbi:hypothetical protein BD410DRAFT_788606 [Rickenella mellea]|uniref:Uncharacterized protein n=1 Tax=Rickenella mellea TaxID=50990 RepID=A0A4Y7Q4N2_9AGAM|nr:hypothetical protein BD410DRAFT_788606 [Rickenella mellea]
MASARGPPGLRPKLPVELVAKSTREAQKDGLFAGLTSGFVASLMGNRFLGFNRNKTILCAVLTGCASGYYFTQGFLSSRLAALEAQQANLTPPDSEYSTEFSPPS